MGATLQLARIKAVSAYVKAIGAMRMAFIGLLMLKIIMGLLLAGFILLHIALLIYVPLPMETKALVLLVLSIAYLLIGIIVLSVLCSQKLWMKYSKASDMVRQTICQH